jgi:hypothetical protein
VLRPISSAGWKRGDALVGYLTPAEFVSDKAPITNPQMSNDRVPKTLRTEKFGELDFYEATYEDIYCLWYCGSCSNPRYGDFEVVFYPPNDDGTGWTEALASAEQRGEDILSAQAAILQTGGEHLSRLFKDYHIKLRSIYDVLPSLTISMLQLRSTENDKLVYAPSKWFPNFELFISIDRDLRVTETYFDG